MRLVDNKIKNNISNSTDKSDKEVLKKENYNYFEII